MTVNILQGLGSIVGTGLGVQGTGKERAAFAELWLAYSVKGYHPQVIQEEDKTPTIAIILKWNPRKALEEFQPQIDEITTRVKDAAKKYDLNLTCSPPIFGCGGGGYVMWVEYEGSQEKE